MQDNALALKNPATNDMPDAAPSSLASSSPDVSDARLEVIAKDIETLQTTAVRQVSERLAEARAIFRYRRDEGGFTGWVERRLKLSQSTVYNLLSVHDRLGSECFQLLETLPTRALYAIAAPSCPDEARTEIIERAEAGEKLPVAEVKHIIKAAQDSKPSRRHGARARKSTIGDQHADHQISPVAEVMRHAEAAREIPIEKVKEAFAADDGEIARLQRENEDLKAEIADLAETRTATLSTLIVAARSEYAPIWSDMTAAERTLVQTALETLDSTREAIRARRENKAAKAKAKAKAKADAKLARASQARNPEAQFLDDTKTDVMLADGLPEKCRRTEHDADRDVEATAATTTRLQ